MKVDCGAVSNNVGSDLDSRFNVDEDWDRFFCASFGVVSLSGGSWLHQRGAVLRVCACEEQ